MDWLSKFLPTKNADEKVLNILSRDFKVETHEDIQEIQNKFDILIATMKLVGYEQRFDTFFDTIEELNDVYAMTHFYLGANYKARITIEVMMNDEDFATKVNIRVSNIDRDNFIRLSYNLSDSVNLLSDMIDEVLAYI